MRRLSAARWATDERGFFAPGNRFMTSRIFLVFLTFLPVGDVFADDDATKPAASSDSPMQREGRVQGLFSVDHELSMRVRPEVVVGGDLDSSGSPIPKALNAEPGELSTLAWSSMRLRYAATVHLGQRFRLRLSADAFDNMVLGSLPTEAYRDFNAGIRFDSQEPPTAGVNSFEDALAIREVYGSWQFLSLVDVDFGRMRDHFGSGLIRHRGDCLDCDRGSIFDGIRAGLDLFGLRAEMTVELTDVGAVEAHHDAGGQPRDYGVDDDTVTYTVRVLSSRQASRSPNQRETDELEIDKLRVDWGLFFAFTEQVLSTERQGGSVLPNQCTDDTGTALSGPQLPWDCWLLHPRKLFIWKPSVWTRLDWRPDFSSRLTLEVELAGQFGDAQHLQSDPDLGDTSKVFEGFGGTVEFTYQQGALTTGIMTGFATGDDARYLGYLDGQNILERDDANYEANENVKNNGAVTSFWFNPDYKLDLLLFRQIIGGVTNAYYIKPWISYGVLSTDDLALTVRLDVAYAGSTNPEGTPGKGSHWGVEVDAGIQADFSKGFKIGLDGAVLLPMNALRDPLSGVSPETAYAFRGLLTWSL